MTKQKRSQYIAQFTLRILLVTPLTATAHLFRLRYVGSLRRAVPYVLHD